MSDIAAVIAAAALMASPAKAAESDAQPRAPTSYGWPLGLSYLAMPALAFGGLLAFGDASDEGGALVATSVIIVGLGAPVAVHVGFGQAKRGLSSPLGTIGSTALAGLGGLAVGAVVAGARCPPSNPDSDSDSCQLGSVLMATYLGAGAGYVGWAIYDTVARSTTDDGAGPTIAVAPALGRGLTALQVVGTF